MRTETLVGLLNRPGYCVVIQHGTGKAWVAQALPGTWRSYSCRIPMPVKFANRLSLLLDLVKRDEFEEVTVLGKEAQ